MAKEITPVPSADELRLKLQRMHRRAQASEANKQELIWRNRFLAREADSRYRENLQLRPLVLLSEMQAEYIRTGGPVYSIGGATDGPLIHFSNFIACVHALHVKHNYYELHLFEGGGVVTLHVHKDAAKILQVLFQNGYTTAWTEECPMHSEWAHSPWLFWRQQVLIPIIS